MWTFFISTMLSILKGIYGEEIRIITPAANESNANRYIILPNLADEIKNNQLHFNVKACNGVYVALINGNTENEPLYEIIIGGWNNTKSVLNTKKKQSIPSAKAVGSVLKCTQFQNLTIDWNNKEISVQDEESQNKVLIYRSQTELNHVKNIGVYSGFGGTGEWIFNTTSDVVSKFYTPDSYDGKYIIVKSYPVVSHKSVTFEVKACHDAYIALINGETNSDPLYEIVIGALNKILLRMFKQQIQEAKSVIGKPYFINCNDYHAFRIDWDSNKISIGTVGTGTSLNYNKVLEWTDQIGLHPIKHIGFYTGNGVSGEWNFYRPVNGGFSRWSSWGPCSSTCGNSRQRRTRSSTDPIPQYGGLQCIGPSEESQTCTTQQCSSNSNHMLTQKSTSMSIALSTIDNSETTTGEYISENTATSTSTSSVLKSSTTENASMVCMCSCQQVGKWSILAGLNLTKKEIEKILQPDIEKWRISMAIRKKSVSSYIRGKTSADDKRKGPQYWGWFSIVIICIVVLIVIILDCVHIHN